MPWQVPAPLLSLRLPEPSREHGRTPYRARGEKTLLFVSLRLVLFQGGASCISRRAERRARVLAGAQPTPRLSRGGLPKGMPHPGAPAVRKHLGNARVSCRGGGHHRSECTRGRKMLLVTDRSLQRAVSPSAQSITCKAAGSRFHQKFLSLVTTRITPKRWV